MVLWLRLARSANSPNDRYLITVGSYCRSVNRGEWIADHPAPHLVLFTAVNNPNTPVFWCRPDAVYSVWCVYRGKHLARQGWYRRQRQNKSEVARWVKHTEGI